MRESGERIALAAGAGARHARQQPRRDLPVAAYPAVAARHVRAIACRVVLVQLHVAHQCRARITAFQQVVTQYAVLGKAVLQRRFERIDVVDALADEGAFAEYVLVDIGGRACVRIDAGLGAEQARVARPVGPRQAHGDARLQDAVATNHPWSLRARGGLIEARVIQRVRHGAHELPRRIARQLRIGVESNHVFHRQQHLGRARYQRKPVRPAAQQRI